MSMNTTMSAIHVRDLLPLGASECWGAVGRLHRHGRGIGDTWLFSWTRGRGLWRTFPHILTLRR